MDDASDDLKALHELPARKSGQLWLFHGDGSVNLLLAEVPCQDDDHRECGGDAWSVIGTYDNLLGKHMTDIGFGSINAHNWELLEGVP